MHAYMCTALQSAAVNVGTISAVKFVIVANSLSYCYSFIIVII